MTELLSANQAAEELGISGRHVRRLLAEGKLKGQKVGVWQWAISRQEVDRYLRERQKA